MAASIGRTLSLCCRSLLSVPTQSGFEAVRHASKKAGGASKNKRKRTIKKNRGIKVQEGEWVHSGSVLATQLHLRYYPGQNVGLGGCMTLYAMENGTVSFSRENLSPYPHSPLYAGVKSGSVIERLFLHIKPDVQHNNFRMVSLI